MVIHADPSSVHQMCVSVETDEKYFIFTGIFPGLRVSNRRRFYSFKNGSSEKVIDIFYGGLDYK